MRPFSFRQRLKSFSHAVRGAATLVSTQHNAWIHIVATAVVLVTSVIARVSGIDWALLIVAIALVWIAESLNTAIEFLGDEITEERRDRIGKAKDVAAFAVLISAIASVVIGTIVFLPYIKRLI
ncbi:MAG TPA: diacylglycerol kinase family protein [Lacunisphaera sp.]|jgi:diacylglycerol kinase (ATP)